MQKNPVPIKTTTNLSASHLHREVREGGGKQTRHCCKCKNNNDDGIVFILIIGAVLIGLAILIKI